MEKRITEFFSETASKQPLTWKKTDGSGHIYQNSCVHTFHFSSSNLHLAGWISWHSQFFPSGKKS